MPHYSQARHAVSVRKHSLDSMLEGVRRRRQKCQDENHVAEENALHNWNHIEAEVKSMISYCEQAEQALREEI
ncbi:hypothetical protein HCJ66_15600 [Listeria sp. FSL L7-1582]|uniref:hypothetical protein n=1 Tax=Listeria portnoyi TaxID=2713504 RepID=UPI00164E44FC|nr:hypothetical protein [Listeria portnoyi]MBC6310961.1 hypothetical protein [Listeria portnoyi]